MAQAGPDAFKRDVAPPAPTKNRVEQPKDTEVDLGEGGVDDQRGRTAQQATETANPTDPMEKEMEYGSYPGLFD